MHMIFVFAASVLALTWAAAHANTEEEETFCKPGTTECSVLRAGDKKKTLYDAIKCQLSFPKIIPGKVPPDNLEKGLQDDGVHRIKASKPVGLVVYGFNADVSYGYPGGTELKLINLK